MFSYSTKIKSGIREVLLMPKAKQQRRNQRETNSAESLMEVSYRALSHSQRTSNSSLMEYISR